MIKITLLIELMTMIFVSLFPPCNSDTFPNVNSLLRIAYTMPVTSADNERANSTFKLVKGCLRITMTTERLSGLAVMNIHCEKPFKYDAVVQLFALFSERYPQRMLFVDPVFDKSQN